MCDCMLLQEGTRQRLHRCVCTPGCWPSHGSTQQSSSWTWRAGHCWQCCMNMQVHSRCSALHLITNGGLMRSHIHRAYELNLGSITTGTSLRDWQPADVCCCCFSLLQLVATHLYCMLIVLLSTGWRGASAQDPGQYGRHGLQQLNLSLLLPTTFGTSASIVRRQVVSNFG